MFRLAEQKYSKVSSIPSKRRVSCAFIPRFYHPSFFSARTGEDTFAIGLQVGSGRVCVCQTIFSCRKGRLGYGSRHTATVLQLRPCHNVPLSTSLQCLRSIPKRRTVRLMFFIVSLRNISMSTSAYLKYLQSLPNRFYASGGHTFGERHGYVIMWKERAELSQVIRGFTSHVRKDGIRIFLLQCCKFLSFGGELYHEDC